MTDLDRAIRSFRAAALARERAASTALIDAYGAIWRDLQAPLRALNADIAAARARGDEPSRAWLLRQERYTTLIAQTEGEITRYARYAEQVVLNERRAAVAAAMQGVDALMVAALGTPPPGVAVSFNRLPVAAVEQLAGALADNAPLRALFDTFGKEASKAAGEALVSAVGRGIGPRETAKALRLALNETPVRALRIARTELNRSFRDASLANYRENAAVLEGWTWICACTSRSCGACFARHGKVYRLDQPFASHPQCRCCAAPRSRSWEDLLGLQGIPDTRPTIRPGSALFEELSEADQRIILGVGKHAAWLASEFVLADLPAPTRSARWGAGMRERSLRELRAAGAREAAD